jgi:transposase
MGKPYSGDLRERVAEAVVMGGLSCNRAAKQFGVGVSTAIVSHQLRAKAGSQLGHRMAYERLSQRGHWCFK